MALEEVTTAQQQQQQLQHSLLLSSCSSCSLFPSDDSLHRGRFRCSVNLCHCTSWFGHRRGHWSPHRLWILGCFFLWIDQPRSFHLQPFSPFPSGAWLRNQGRRDEAGSTTRVFDSLRIWSSIHSALRVRHCWVNFFLDHVAVAIIWLKKLSRPAGSWF